MTTHPEPEARPRLTDLQEARTNGPEALAAFVGQSHPADLADWLEQLEPDEAWEVFSAADEEKQVRVLDYSETEVRGLLVEKLPGERLAEMIEQLPDDEVADLLPLADPAKKQTILRNVERERADDLRELSLYPPDTAGGLMTTQFVAMQQGERVGDAIKAIKSQRGPALDEDVGVFVVDVQGCPIGHLTERDLITTSIHSPIEEAMDDEIVKVSAGEDQENVAHRFRKYGLPALPVVDDAGRLIGVISAEDVMHVLESEAAEDLMRVVGTSAREQTRLPVLSRVRARIPMQALTVMGGLTTAYILDHALGGGEQRTHTANLLRYLPIVIGLAGNVGIQCSTILVRAFATGEADDQSPRQILAAEVLVGTIIGLLCGSATMFVSSLLEYDGGLNLVFGSAVGSAITVAVIWAAFLGCLVPMGCKRVGIDPAIVAGPFLITLSDISGSAIFVGVAHLILGMHG